MARTSDTRDRLLDAAFRVVREQGLGAATARTIAARAGVNQALVFYHFDSVDSLVAAASDRAVTASVEAQRESVRTVESLPDLVRLASAVRERETREGNIAVMGELLAGGSRSEVLAAAAQRAVTTWTGELSGVLSRVIPTGSPLPDSDVLAHLLVSGFVGLELVGRVAPGANDAALAAVAGLVPQIQALATPHDPGT